MKAERGNRRRQFNPFGKAIGNKKNHTVFVSSDLAEPRQEDAGFYGRFSFQIGRKKGIHPVQSAHENPAVAGF